MANWALVIGCDEYVDPTPSLKGAVRDALDVREWLLSRDGGAVPRQNLTFLAAPSAAGASVPSGVTAVRPVRDNVVLAVTALLQRSKGDEGRLFVFFAGHGLTVRADFYNEPALICADFTASLTTKAIAVRAIREQFLAATLTPQFFIFDACRNVPFPGEFRVSEFDRPSQPDYTRAQPDQFQCSATSPGLRSHELGAAGDERGAFTAAMLRGLAGDGRAKRFDPAQERYVVRFDDLFQYVSDDVRSRRLGADGIQAPSRVVSGVAANPVLATFPAGTFAAVDLTVTVEPAASRPAASLEVAGPYDASVVPPPLREPLVLTLEPRSYSLRARAPSLISHPPGIPVELYEPQAIRIDLHPAQLHPAQPEPLTRSLDPGPFRSLDPDPGPFRGSGGAPRRARLTVRAEDRLATVEAINEAGDTQMALGNLVLTHAGQYRVHVRTPDGVGPQQLVEVVPGSDDVLTAPSPPPSSTAPRIEAIMFTEMLHSWGGPFERPGTGPAEGADARLVIVLACHVDAPPVLARTDGSQALLAPIGTLFAPGEALGGAGEEFRGAGEEFRAPDEALRAPDTGLIEPDTRARLRMATLYGRPGPALLRLTGLRPSGAELGIAVHLEPARPTFVVVEAIEAGRLAVYQHGLPGPGRLRGPGGTVGPGGPGGTVGPGGPGRPGGPGGLGGPDPDVLRAADLAERFARQGAWRQALQLLSATPQSQSPRSLTPQSPQSLTALSLTALSLTALSLRGYLLLATSTDPRPAQEVAELLLARDPAFVDAQLMFALTQARQGSSEDEVRERVGSALAGGYPVIDMGLTAALGMLAGAAPGQLPGSRVAEQMVTTFAIDRPAPGPATW